MVAPTENQTRLERLACTLFMIYLTQKKCFRQSLVHKTKRNHNDAFFFMTTISSSVVFFFRHVIKSVNYTEGKKKKKKTVCFSKGSLVCITAAGVIIS